MCGNVYIITLLLLLSMMAFNIHKFLGHLTTPWLTLDSLLRNRDLLQQSKLSLPNVDNPLSYVNNPEVDVVSESNWIHPLGCERSHMHWSAPATVPGEVVCWA